MYPCIGFEQHSKYHDKTVYGHIAATVAAAEPTVEARLTMPVSYTHLNRFRVPMIFIIYEGGK